MLEIFLFSPDDMVFKTYFFVPSLNFTNFVAIIIFFDKLFYTFYMLSFYNKNHANSAAGNAAQLADLN